MHSNVWFRKFHVISILMQLFLKNFTDHMLNIHCDILFKKIFFWCVPCVHVHARNNCWGFKFSDLVVCELSAKLNYFDIFCNTQNAVSHSSCTSKYDNVSLLQERALSTFCQCYPRKKLMNQMEWSVQTYFFHWLLFEDSNKYNVHQYFQLYDTCTYYPFHHLLIQCL